MMRPTSVTSYLPALTPIADEFVAKYENTLRIDDSLKTLVKFTTESNYFNMTNMLKMAFHVLLVLSYYTVL